MNGVILSPEYFPDPTIGRPVANADIYVGEPDTDPEVVINQKQISVQQENGTIVAVSQPISTGSGGVPLYIGTPVTILVEGDYSLKVNDSAGAQVYYVPSQAYLLGTVTEFATYTEMRASTPTADNKQALVAGRSTAGDGGSGRFYFDTADLSTEVTADTLSGVYVAPDSDATGASGCWIRQDVETVNPEWFGATGDGVTDDTASVQAAVTFALPWGVVEFQTPSVFFNVTDTVSVLGGITVRGPGKRSAQLPANESTIKFTGVGGGNTAVFSQDNFTDDLPGATIQDLNIDAGAADAGIRFRSVRSQVLNCVIRNGNFGIYYLSGADVASGGVWNGEHRVNGCDILEQDTYGILISGTTVLDSFINDNWIYGYGAAGINFGVDAKPAGWKIDNNHTYPGTVKEISAGVPKMSININNNAQNFLIEGNTLGGGVLIHATAVGNPTGIITNNHFNLASSADQIGLLINIDAGVTYEVEVSDNIFSQETTALASVTGIKTVLADATAVCSGRFTNNNYAASISTLGTTENFDDSFSTRKDVSNWKQLQTQVLTNAQQIIFLETETEPMGIYFSTIAPEGVITAGRGSICMNQGGGAAFTLWVKETGINTNTGWVGK